MFAARSSRGAQNLCPSSTFVKMLSWVCSQKKKLSYVKDPLQDLVEVKGKHRDSMVKTWVMKQNWGMGKDRCRGI